MTAGNVMRAMKMMPVCHDVAPIQSRGIWHGDNPLDYSIPSLLMQVSLISIITRVVYFVLKPFGQPLIVSQIFGGVILGPSIFGQNIAFSEKVFPKKGRNVLDTLSLFGFTLFIFLIGVKMDPRMVVKSSKKILAIGILGFFVPYILTNFVAFLLKHFLSLDREISKILPAAIAMQSMTSFPVIACFLDDLKILNSELGRLALSSSIICDICHWTIMSIMYTARIAMAKSLKLSIGSLLSFTLYFFVIVFGVRPAALWVIRHTPEGRPVKDVYIYAALIALLCCGFIGELIGLSSILASLAIGLAIPDGPPLGAALVERLDCFVSVLLMPLFFTICGLQMNIFAIVRLKNVGIMLLVVLVGFVGKIIGTILPPLFYRMPVRDAISLALIMNSKGIVELAILNDWKQSDILNEESYAIMILLVVLVTGVISPLVKTIYDPSKRYIAYKRRTIAHLRPTEELRILACIHGQEDVRAIMALLQVSTPKRDTRVNLVVLHLIRLIGRASSILVRHHDRDSPSLNPSLSEIIFNAFKKLEAHSQGGLYSQCYKGISPYVTMHNDVCSLALEKRTILIVLPFHKQWCYSDRVETTYAYRHLNKKVLEKAPCSIGILVDRGCKKPRYVIADPVSYHVAVLFFGGADDREALAYAKRMWQHPNVMVTLIRFIRSGLPNQIVGSTERSNALDEEALNGFNLGPVREGRAFYHEELISSGAEVVAMTRSIMEKAYDLVVVGRRHRESLVMSQLAMWHEKGELGAIGEILAWSEFEPACSALVVQQQTRLWGLQDPEESTHLRRVNL